MNIRVMTTQGALVMMVDATNLSLRKITMAVVMVMVQMEICKEVGVGVAAGVTEGVPMTEAIEVVTKTTSCSI